MTTFRIYLLCSLTLAALMASGARAEAAEVTPVSDLGPGEKVHQDPPQEGDEDPAEWVDPFSDPQLLEGIALPLGAASCASVAAGATPPFAGLVGISLASGGAFPLALPCCGLSALGMCATPVIETLVIVWAGNQNPRWPNLSPLDPYVLMAAFGSYGLGMVSYFAAGIALAIVAGIGSSSGLFPFFGSPAMNQYGWVIGLAMAVGGAFTLLALQPIVPLVTYLYLSSGVVNAPELRFPGEVDIPPPPDDGPSVIHREQGTSDAQRGQKSAPRGVAF